MQTNNKQLYLNVKQNLIFESVLQA